MTTTEAKAAVAAITTERVVLRKVKTTANENDRWEVLGTVKAASKTAAIKALAKEEPGQYRAPSARSWKGGLEIVLPAKPKVEQRLFDD